MFEIIEFLVEKPAKLRKVVFFFLKVILSIIFASKFYTHVFGQYRLLDISEKTFWIEIENFVLNGRMLIVFFIFLISKFLLFDVFAAIVSKLLEFIIRKIYSLKSLKNDHEFILFYLKIIRVIKIHEKTKKVEAGKMFDDYYRLYSAYRDKEAKTEIHSLKHTIMDETLHSYFAFMATYFLFQGFIKTDFFSLIVILGLVLNLLFYMVIHCLIEFLNVFGDNIFTGMIVLNNQRTVDDFIKEYHFRTISHEESEQNSSSRIIRYNKIEYVIDFYPGKLKITTDIVDRFYRNFSNKENQIPVLISQKKMSKTARKHIKKLRLSLQVIHLKKNKNLEKKLKNIILEK